MLRHVVLFQFKDETPPEKVTEIEEAFCALPARISEVTEFEWGTDVSVQGFARGFTHCFLVTTANEADRDSYGAHPEHQAFLSLSRPHVEQILTFDYFATDAGGSAV
ncbi:Dabb family protein [bacterium]|nr:Dabb family protein [bacterium]